MPPTDPDNPFITPRPRGTRLIQGTLRVTVTLQCWGLAAGWLHQHRSNPLIDLLAQGQEIGTDQFVVHQDAIAYALVVAGVLTMLRPMTLVLVPLIAYQAALAISMLALEQGPVPVLEPALQATRYMVPLALLFVDFWPPKLRPTLVLCLSAIGLLRLALVATLAAQGIHALIQHQPGGDLSELLTLAAKNGFQSELTPAVAQLCLVVVAAVNLSLATCLLAGRLRGVAAVVVVWELANACSWTVAYGQAGYDLSLVRMTDVGAALAILFFWTLAVREQPPVFIPDATDL